MTHEVLFHPLAVEDLNAIDDRIAQDSAAHAAAFLRRLRAQCERLSAFPRRGHRRPDLPGEIRTIAFERTAVIAYRIEPGRVIVLRIVMKGLDLPDLGLS